MCVVWTFFLILFFINNFLTITPARLKLLLLFVPEFVVGPSRLLDVNVVLWCYWATADCQRWEVLMITMAWE